MHLIIHRGTKEIGGSCVELKSKNTRILIDFGMPLVDTAGKKFDSNILKHKTIDQLKALKILPDIKGLYKNDKKEIDAIILSHSHLDHYGLFSYVNPEIPIYMSRGAKELIEISDIFIPTKIGKINAKVIDKLKPFTIGDIKIRPYLVDHSAFDALAFLVEADGKRIFYSGDFRGHGRKSILFLRMIKNPPKNIDCLMMEGSTLGRDDKEIVDEETVQKMIEDVLARTSNIMFISASSQNIDRLVSAYKACIHTDSIFVIDLYTAFILDRLKAISKGIPQYNWKNMRVKYFKYHADCLVKAGFKTLLYKYNSRKIEMDEINRKQSHILMLLRDNSIFDAVINNLRSAYPILIYSMWEGYLKKEFIEKCLQKGIRIAQMHTSGHAYPSDLKKFASVMAPKVLIPIHTFSSARYKELFKGKINILKDGEVYSV